MQPDMGYFPVSNIDRISEEELVEALENFPLERYEDPLGWMTYIVTDDGVIIFDMETHNGS